MAKNEEQQEKVEVLERKLERLLQMGDSQFVQDLIKSTEYKLEILRKSLLY